MSTIIGVLNPKGGSGKTTLATNLARALQLRGDSVLIVDTDPQGTARDWRASASEDSEVPGVVGITEARTLTRDLERLGASYDVVVIDGSAKVKNLTGAAVKTSDVVLIPLQPSPADIWGASDLVDILQARRQVTGGQPKAAFIISRQITGTNLASDVAEVLSGYDLPVFEGRTSQRVAYAEAMIVGSTVLDENSKSKAAQEIEAITDELIQLVHAKA